MTDRWRGVFVFGALGVALVLLLHVAAGCGDGDKGGQADAAVVATDAGATDVATTTTDSGGGSDAAEDASPLADAAPPPDASLPDAP